MGSINPAAEQRGLRSGGGLRTAFILAVFAAAFLLLTLSSYMRTSATWDEPLHLSCGYAALRHGDYRFGPGHPPFLRMWAALPLLATPGVRMNTTSLNYVLGKPLGIFGEFLYRDNDGDRLLYRARFMIVLLGILLGMVLFVWASELHGVSTAVVVLALYCLEPNILAHSSLVTTDVGLNLFYFGTAFFLWRLRRALTIPSVLGLCVCFALAQVSKFTGVLLAPVVLALLLLRALVPEPWPVAMGRTRSVGSQRGKVLVALSLTALLLAVTVTTIWGVHRFRFEMNAGAELPNVFESERNMQLGNPYISRFMMWLEHRHLLPRAYTGGFRNALGIFQGDRYLGGVFHKEPVWYFYPAVFLLKTPTSLIILAAAGALTVIARIRRRHWEWLFLAVPPALYLTVAVLSPLNTGVRHILTLYPFLILMAGYAVRPLLVSRSRMYLLAGLGCMLLAETAVAYPDFLAAFNLPARGLEGRAPWLLDSNLDWGQDLKRLKLWMDARGIREINLSYFGTADPNYYGIDAAYLSGGASARAPRFPGYVAVSLTNLYAFFDGEPLRAFYAPLRARKPDAIVGRSIYVWWVDRPWWQ